MSWNGRILLLATTIIWSSYGFTATIFCCDQPSKLALSLAKSSRSNPKAQPSKKNQDNRLSRELKREYQMNGTHGVLESLLRRKPANGSSGSEIVIDPSIYAAAVLQASDKGDRGLAAALFHAYLAYCCCCCYDNNDNSSCGSKIKDAQSAARTLMGHYEDSFVQPNLVTFCLAYEATPDEHVDSMTNPFLIRTSEQYDKHPASDHAPTQHDSSRISSKKKKALAEQHGITILQEKDDWIVIDKPSGMVCYHGATEAATPAKRRRRGRKGDDRSVEDCLLQVAGISLSTLNAKKSSGRGMVHRLDRGTSGCLVLAKTNEAHARLVAQFFVRVHLSKTYEALVIVADDSSRAAREWNETKTGAVMEGVIDLPIDGRPARSHYRVDRLWTLQNYDDHENENDADPSRTTTLARLTLTTRQGRRHQVRQHCARGLGCPIVLDATYGGLDLLATHGGHGRRRRQLATVLQNHRSHQRLALHAATLGLAPNVPEQRAPRPDWWTALEEEFLECKEEES